MRSQAQQQSNNTVPMSYFRKYILLLIYTFIHKINNHKKIIRLNKILRKKKGDNPTLYNSFGISGCIIHAFCTKGCSGGVRAGAGWGRVTDSDVALNREM